jgi:hypothetical protein
MIVRSHQIDPGRSVLALLHPRRQEWLFAGLLVAGLAAGWLGTARWSMPLWAAVALAFGLLLYPAARKWRVDRQELGTPAMVLSILLATQGFHTIEHVAQWLQYHLLGWPLKASSGLISPLNAEIVHFTWNWAVLLVVAYLLLAGIRNRWMWLLLAWASAHSAEHTYMFINYLDEVERLASQGLPISGAQGLPGFLGRGGWLAANAPTGGPVGFLCTIAPGLTDAPRLDVHFWWNMGEVVLLLLAAHTTMRGRPSPADRASIK